MTAALSAAKRILLDRLLRGAAAAPSAPEIERRTVGSVVPISPEQEHVWLHAAMAPGLPLYNEPVTLHRRGSFDHGRFTDSLNEIIRQWEILRTGFELHADGIVQRVADDVVISVPLTDLRHLPGPERETTAVEIATREARLPFDLSRPPLLRCHVVQMATEEHRVYFTLHHIIFDGVSIYRLFVPRLAATYEALGEARTNPRSSGPSAALQYGDYAAWRGRHVRTAEVERHLDHWREVLAGDLPSLGLPADHSVSPNPGFTGATETFAIPRPLTEELSRTARQHGLTDFALLLTVFKVLLFRYSGQTDLIVGSVTDMRHRLQLEEVFGYFLNNIPIRTRPSYDMSFMDYAKQTNAAVVAALDASDVPFSRILRELHLPREGLTHPLFQVMFSMDPAAPTFPEGWDLTQMDVSVGTAKFDLYLELDERPGGLIGRLVYRTDVFEAATARRLVSCWHRLLESVAADPSCPLGELDLLTRVERQQQTHWNETNHIVPDETVHALIFAQAERTPDAIAVASEEESVTYRELDRRAAQVASQLTEAGVGTGALVALCVERSVALVAALLGVLRTGAAYLPLDPKLPLARLALYLAEAAPDAILASPSLLPLLPEFTGPTLVIDDGAASPAVESRAAFPGPEGLAYVLFTSGTTGTPKAVEVTHRALLNLLMAMQREVAFCATDSWLAVSTISFDIAALELFLPLLSGGRVILAARDTVADPARLAEFAARARPSVMQATPTLWGAMIEAGWSGQEDLKLLCGGEALSRSLAASLLQRAQGVWNLYGPTETTIWSTLHRIDPCRGPVPIGRPIANTTVFVLDERGHPVPLGVVGELHIGGTGLARGYRHRRELTQERFLVRPGTLGQRVYRTGDLVRFRADGALEWVGRIDKQVKIRGHRINLDEIEAGLAAHPAVAVAAVERRHEGIVAYVVPVDDPPTEHDIRGDLRDIFPDIMVPDRITFVPSLPRTPNGKLDRAALPRPKASVALEVPAIVKDESEASLLEIFRDVLGRRDVTRDENFFDAGGHSLLAAQVLRRVEQLVGRRLALPAIFRFPSVVALAAHLAESGDPPSFGGAHRALMLHFESLGEDCEFGLVQRRHGADPLGLLRFTGIATTDLITALEDRFVAMDDPACLRAEWREDRAVIHNDRYHCSYELPLRPALGRKTDVLLAQEASKLRFLRSALFRTLKRGERICVIKTAAGTSPDQISHLQALVSRYGPNTLLWVQASDDRHEAGTVEKAQPGLLFGWIDRFASPDALTESSPLWPELCQAALRLWRPDP